MLLTSFSDSIRVFVCVHESCNFCLPNFLSFYLHFAVTRPFWENRLSHVSFINFHNCINITSYAVFSLLYFCAFAALCLHAWFCLAPSVSVSLLVFFWKITRSGAVRVHVFCAGCTGWMGWLHWAGFLCGPPANFMIYSAKGRGARPPVTTERELHVGLMISPQKCLLWLGLRGAQSPPTG